MSRVELAKIPSLNFYKGEDTTARRTSPIPQLVCIGKPCQLYQPEVVRCVNIGGTGTDVDWKCEADLPSSLRFGKVEVGCEGWSRAGDPYVLKGSCSLQYRLVQVPGALRDSDSPIFSPKSYDWPSIAFSVLWVGFLLVIVYSFLKSCLRNNTTNGRTPRPSGFSPGPAGWFPGDHHDDSSAPPPPYSKTQQTPATGRQGWQPGFWTGAAVGGLANHLWNRTRAQNAPSQAYDWETRQGQASQRPRFGTFGGGSNAYRQHDSDDRGEGSSSLGSMRRSTGLGGSNVR